MSQENTPRSKSPSGVSFQTAKSKTSSTSKPSNIPKCEELQNQSVAAWRRKVSPNETNTMRLAPSYNDPSEPSFILEENFWWDDETCPDVSNDDECSPGKTRFVPLWPLPAMSVLDSEDLSGSANQRRDSSGKQRSGTCKSGKAASPGKKISWDVSCTSQTSEEEDGSPTYTPRFKINAVDKLTEEVREKIPFWAPKFNSEGELIYPLPRAGPVDALNMEFMYYAASLRVAAPLMSRQDEKLKVLSWIRKLFAPAYETAANRINRNKLLLSLTISVLNDELSGTFAEKPEKGDLPDASEVWAKCPPKARWEHDTYWEDLIRDLPEKEKMKCSVHEECFEDANQYMEEEPVAGVALDQEFKFMLYLARPYVALLPGTMNKTRCALWLTKLAAVSTCSCLYMKGIRNDYMQVLLGYLQDLRITGPFSDIPPSCPLGPLSTAAKFVGKRYGMLMGAENKEANEFLAMQPTPTEGAFCYIALSGDLAATSNMFSFKRCP